MECSNASKLFMDFYHSESAQKIMLESGFPIGRLGLKSKYPEFTVAIYDLKGYTPIDWRKIGDQEKDDMREELRGLVVERK
jgi:ABC-type Fe3+ transport system substrate-binding protein